ncbi:MAG TPA: thioredoxin-like domain-containing protein, partial [Dysgonamonadaceae bacterium]|nr:thioredoxin-like domain-containing protein [Dysgonamonadaceae bacterium]
YRTFIDTLTTFTFYFNDYASSAVVFADKGEKITIKGDATLPDLIQVNGNEINDDLTLFKKENEALLKQRAELLNSMKMDRLENTNHGVLSENEKIVRLNSLNHELTQKAEDFIKKNPAKIASVILINNLFRDTENPTTLERVLGYLEGAALEFPLTEDLKTHCDKMKLSAEGAYFPYFQLVDIKNDTIRSSDFSGKYLVLSFLSAVGVESRNEVIALKNEYEKLNKDSVQFISIYIDFDKYPIASTSISNDSIPWITVTEKKSWASNIVETYNIRYVPYNILITPDGRIKRRNIPAQEVQQTIERTTKWS